MGDQEETQEQMKADMSALKEQMASMIEAMLGMRQLENLRKLVETPQT